MIACRKYPCAAQASPTVIEGFRSAATAVISDNLSRLPGAVGIRPFHKAGVLVGTAFTVRTCPGDNLVIHEALDLIRPGDVLVVDGGGDTSRALLGEIMLTIAQSRGAAGIVIDGAIRDVGAISQSPFPCFAKAAIHKGPYKNGPGEINVPVTIGGMVVEPGDVIVGDDDGVVAFSQAMADDLLKAVRAQEAREAEILLSIQEGRYTGAYAKPAEK
jgi:RraA family protein